MIAALLHHRRDREAARAEAHAAELQAMAADMRRARQEAAWATYAPNIAHPAFVGSAVAR